MPQWGVFDNPVAATRGAMPYLVVLQSDLLEALETRWVAPLARTSPSTRLPQRLAPAFDVAGERVSLWPQLAGAIQARLLRKPVASLRSESFRIVDAIDAMISGI